MIPSFMSLYRTTLKTSVVFSYLVNGTTVLRVKYKKLGHESKNSDSFNYHQGFDQGYKNQRNVQYKIGNGKYRKAKDFNSISRKLSKLVA